MRNVMVKNVETGKLEPFTLHPNDRLYDREAEFTPEIDLRERFNLVIKPHGGQPVTASLLADDKKSLIKILNKSLDYPSFAFV